MPRFTEAGQTHPEPSPYDRPILDRHMRHVGDVAAIVAGRDAKAVDRALRLIRPSCCCARNRFLDFHKALDNPIRTTHPEDNWACQAWTGADNKRNLLRPRGVLARRCQRRPCRMATLWIDRTYHTKAVQQAFTEPFCAWCSKDARAADDRLFDADRFPRAAQRSQCARHPEIHDPRGQAACRRRFRGKADQRLRNVPALLSPGTPASRP